MLPVNHMSSPFMTCYIPQAMHMWTFLVLLAEAMWAHQINICIAHR